MKFSGYKIDDERAIVRQNIGGVDRLVASPEHLKHLLALDDSHVVRSKSTKIWRYMKLEYAEKLLRSSQLYLPRVDKLNEPLEGSFCPPLVESAYPEEMKVTLEQAQKWAEEHGKFRKEFMQASFYVSCWHVSDAESEMMWNRYLTGENGKQQDGVAFYTSIERLLRLTPGPFDLSETQVVPVRFAGDVTYIDHTIPGIIPEGELTLFYKDESFHGDNEFRLIVKLWAYGWEHFDRSSWPGGFEIGFTPGALIDGMVLSKNVSKEAEQRVTELAIRHDSQIKIQRSRLERAGIW